MGRRVLVSILAGTAVFLLNHAAPISGALFPPAGYEPTGFVTSADVPQYLAFIEAARTHWLLPNIHMVTPGEPAMFHPLALAAGRTAQWTGMSNGQVYYAVSLLLHWFCMAAWLWLLEVYCPSRGQRIAAMAVTVCAVPLKLLALPYSKLIGAIGMIEYGHETSDNFLRGGLGLAWCTGALAVLVTMTLLAKYVRGEKVLGWLVAAVFLNGLLHPFEVALTVPLFALAVRRTVPILAVGLAGAAGVAPYAWMTLRHEWVAEIARNNIWPAPWPGWVILSFGLPAMMAVYLLMVRGKLTEAGDKLLLLWFMLPVGLMYVPVIPFAAHLYNGYAYLLGILVVRLWVTHKKLGRLEPRWALAAATAAAVLALGVYYKQLASDGRAIEPELLTSSVTKPEREALLRWMRKETAPEALVLTPFELAPWMPTILRRAPASHDIVSGPHFGEAVRDLQTLYESRQTTPENVASILRRYKAEYVVAPENTPAAQWLRAHAEPRFSTGGLTVYAVRP